MILRLLMLVGLAFIVFGSSLGAPFHYDDLHSVQFNPHIRSLNWIPTFFIDPSTFSGQARGFMYRPLLLTSFAVDYALWGQNAAAFRVVNLIIHIAASSAFGALAFVFLRSMPGAMVAAALFLVHPAHSEVVNYISARSDALVGLLYLLACVAALGRRQTSMFISYAAGLLTKSVAITLPAMLPMLTGWGRRTGDRKPEIRREIIIAAILSGLYLMVLWRSRFLSHSAEVFPRAISQEIWTQLKALVYYMWMLCTPVHLNVDHPFQVGAALDTPVLLSLAVVVSVLILSLRHRLTIPGFAAIWFGVCMLPYCVLPLNMLVAERRIYLASAGALLLVAWAWRQFRRQHKRHVGWIGIALLASCMVLTVQRNQVWASGTSLWSDAVVKNPTSARARINLALAHRRTDQIDSARVQLREGLRLNADFAEGWVIFGDLAKDAGEGRTALEAYERAISIDPGMEGVYHNLGNLAYAQGDFDQAIEHFERALTINPRFAEARNNLGQALEAAREEMRALVQYERAVKDSMFWIHTDDPVGGAWYNLARLADRLGESNKARAAFEATIRHLSGDDRYEAYVDFSQQRLRDLRERQRGS